jgi:flagellar hook-length control protein FliK
LVNTELNAAVALQADVELAGVALVQSDQQNRAQPPLENLAQARQLLQKAIDAVAGQKTATAQEVIVAEDEAMEPQLLSEEGETRIDPRFAQLLAPRNENRPDADSLRQRIQANNAAAPTTQDRAQTGDAVQLAAEVETESATAQVVEPLVAGPKPAMENLIHQLPGNGQQQHPQAVTGRTMPTLATTVQLPSGQQVAESQIFDQVVTRMSGSFNGESGKMVLRLQPAELGSLKLELIVEGDKVRASLLAQTQQVQEVLERNLPQLRNALAEQGLKIDQFQVDVEQRKEQADQFEQQARQQKQDDSRQQSVWQQDLPGGEEQIVPLAHLMQNGGGGISLRV